MQTKQVNILKEYILNTILPDSTLKKKQKYASPGKFSLSIQLSLLKVVFLTSRKIDTQMKV